MGNWTLKEHSKGMRTIPEWHSKGTRRAPGHSGTQRALVHSMHFGPLKLRHLGTWALKRHLDTRRAPYTADSFS